MNRIDRLQAILTYLQSKRIVRAEDIATRFEVSLRTVYRDIKALEAGGIPIGAEAGVGYFLMEGYHLPPVMFTSKEASALLLVSKLVRNITNKDVETSFDLALTKVKAVLDTEHKDEIDYLDSRIMVHPFPESAKINASGAALFLEELKTAVAQSYVCEFNYSSSHSGEFNRRTVEPIGLIHYSNKWHLIAFCRLRNDYRDFRIDRISKLEMTAEHYAVYKRKSLKEYIQQLVHATELIEVVIEVPTANVKFLENMKYQMGLIAEDVDGFCTTLTFTTFSLEYFSRWVLMMLDKVIIVSPPELKNILATHVLRLRNHYSEEE